MRLGRSGSVADQIDRGLDGHAAGNRLGHWTVLGVHLVNPLDGRSVFAVDFQGVGHSDLLDDQGLASESAFTGDL